MEIFAIDFSLTQSHSFCVLFERSGKYKEVIKEKNTLMANYGIILRNSKAKLLTSFISIRYKSNNVQQY